MKARPEDDEDFPFFCDACGQGLEDEEEANQHSHDGKHYCGTCVGESYGGHSQGTRLLQEVPREKLETWWERCGFKSS